MIAARKGILLDQGPSLFIAQEHVVGKVHDLCGNLLRQDLVNRHGHNVPGREGDVASGVARQLAGPLGIEGAPVKQLPQRCLHCDGFCRQWALRHLLLNSLHR